MADGENLEERNELRWEKKSHKIKSLREKTCHKSKFLRAAEERKQNTRSRVVNKQVNRFLSKSNEI